MTLPLICLGWHALHSLELKKQAYHSEALLSFCCTHNILFRHLCSEESLGNFDSGEQRGSPNPDPISDQIMFSNSEPKGPHYTLHNNANIYKVTPSPPFSENPRNFW